MDEATKRYYWLQLSKDFSEDYRIKILESFENGFAFAYIYIKLLLESINREGKLRFSQERPYTANQLAAVLNIDPVLFSQALEELITLELVIVLEDETFFMPAVKDMTTSKTEWAIQKRKQREKQDD